MLSFTAQKNNFDFVVLKLHHVLNCYMSIFYEINAMNTIRAIISCGLYIFYPISKDHFFVFKEFFFQKILSLCMACIQERLLIKSSLWWRAYGIYLIIIFVLVCARVSRISNWVDYGTSHDNIDKIILEFSFKNNCITLYWAWRKLASFLALSTMRCHLLLTCWELIEREPKPLLWGSDLYYLC